MRRILWFRRDLRIEDNPLLSLGGEVFPIFIFDTDILGSLSPDDRRITFIFQNVMKLKTALKEHGLDLAIFYGKPHEVFKWLLQQSSFSEVCASGDYDSYALERDRAVSHLIEFRYLHDTYIFRPDEIVKNDGTPYHVFTPYYNRSKALFRAEHMMEYFPIMQKLIDFHYDSLHVIGDGNDTLFPLNLKSIGFQPQTLTDSQTMPPHEKLKHFTSRLDEYAAKRDYMNLDATSHLSSDLRFGTISIRAVLRWLQKQKQSGHNTEPFFRQLVFREFYSMLLYHFPHLATQNFRYPFYGVENTAYFDAFCNGRTGVPIIDAGVKELLSTGEMHNRVRMITASFFTKNLLLPWEWGEAFFAKHLMDYDASSNILSWQWSAGTGVDPQPYFRIFNPYLQSKKFDPDGRYITRYLPELSTVSASALHDEKALVMTNHPTYPPPIVSHRLSSSEALEYFKRSLHHRPKSV